MLPSSLSQDRDNSQRVTYVSETTSVGTSSHKTEVAYWHINLDAFVSWQRPEDGIL